MQVYSALGSRSSTFPVFSQIQNIIGCTIMFIAKIMRVIIEKSKFLNLTVCKSPLLAEELLTVDGFWGRQQFP